MGPNRRAQERERAATRAAAEAKRAEAERKAIVEAERIVAIWNARQAGGRALWFYPTIGAAIAAGLPWLTFHAPRAGSSDRSTYAYSIGTPAPQSPALSRQSRAGADDRRRHRSRLAVAHVSCASCGQFGSVDLRILDRHPGAAISSLIPSVSCRRCSPNAPFAKLEMLTAERP